jgi:uncharacterized damage-inducible protein DinB
MDEYERAARELARLVAGLSDDEYERMRDAETADPDCHTIQTILSHVVRAGYGYADYIRSVFGQESTRPEPRLLSRAEALEGIEAFLAYTAETLDGKWLMTYEEITTIQMQVRWGPTYDLEQLLEHAIVHVLRHRRQVERFLARDAAGRAGA